ncbi:hypothetical protein F5144DRAFT_639328 [Chaetomium tenue]|uniref:Uncharacterized protein n=1 Tax=Chaetomium tenue TaxID=1854479 RepID=A0ACB7PR18_9PEZI|nr:hypothetical protein F5144DRAFT_639328 [Chaetomium globosum]
MAPLGITVDDLIRQTRDVARMIEGSKKKFNALLLNLCASRLVRDLSEMLESISTDFQAWRQAMKEKDGWHLIETTEDQARVTNLQQGITNMRESIEELKNQIEVVMNAFEQRNDTTYADGHTLILHSSVAGGTTFGSLWPFFDAPAATTAEAGLPRRFPRAHEFAHHPPALRAAHHYARHDMILFTLYCTVLPAYAGRGRC